MDGHGSPPRGPCRTISKLDREKRRRDALRPPDSAHGPTADPTPVRRLTVYRAWGCADVLLAVVLIRAAQGRVGHMGHIHESVHIDAPVEAAWRLGRDASRMPEWNTTTVEVKDVTGPLEQVGSRVTLVSKVAGRRLDVT